MSDPSHDPPPTLLKTLTSPLVLASFAAHATLHAATSLVLLKTTTLSQSLSPSDIIMIAEKVPSTISALVTSIPSLHMQLSDWPWREDVLRPYPALLDSILAQHIGYTLYNVGIMWIVGGQHPSAWIHHLLGVLGTSLMRHYKLAAFFPAVFLPTELTVVATNALWVLAKLGRTHTKAYSAWTWIRAALFCGIRAPAGVCGLLYALRVVAKQRHAAQVKNETASGEETRRTTASEGSMAPTRAKDPGSLWTQMTRLPALVWILTVINYAAFSGLNIYWTRLVILALKRRVYGARNLGLDGLVAPPKASRAAVGIHHI
ncbi:hypothetical protein HKX48_003628 [Thoreauomyces humboldtii]|nr:hypothetical protein HKX48_003628 [Thoreauomyces humboldtii]